MGGVAGMVQPPESTGEPLIADPSEPESVVDVLTVDDQPVFRDLARLVLQTTEGFRSVGEVSSGEEALEIIDEVKPQLVLVDVRMPGMGGIEAARQIVDVHPEALVVLISIEDPDELPSTAQDSGATALVRKQDFGPTMLRDLWAKYGRKA
jgi:two-component system, NarL family, invasion response regulator UvrY